jgi:hypothetical protein
VTAALRLTVIVYALGVMVVCTWSAVTGRARPSIVTAALAMLEIGVLGQALVDAIAVAQGRHGSELAVHLGYLATSVIVVPVAAASVRLDPRRWGSAALAIGCAVLAVVSLRLDQTLGHA